VQSSQIPAGPPQQVHEVVSGKKKKGIAGDVSTWVRVQFPPPTTTLFLVIPNPISDPVMIGFIFVS
jgi:hypothetical protein